MLQIEYIFYFLTTKESVQLTNVVHKALFTLGRCGDHRFTVDNNYLIDIRRNCCVLRNGSSFNALSSLHYYHYGQVVLSYFGQAV